MERFSLLLLGIWKEISRHARLEETLPSVAILLREKLTAGALGILRVDVGHRCLHAIWSDSTPTSPIQASSQRELNEKDLEDLLAWGGSGKLLRAGDAPAHERLLELLQPVSGTDLIAGPLADETGVRGVFVAVAEQGRQFDPDQELLVQVLLEPLTVALQNDRRVAEITTLREAAEADRLSLLRRLGREAIVDEIVGAESGLKLVMERVELVASSDLPVLILGETGSGKEVIARAIHQRSPRSGGPFLRVNCGAIPSELIDSELFGHEKGSFTGATALRKGWFERADGGSLFLDEVGELTQAAQVRLLRVLQDGTFSRVGGQHALTVDVRVIAATHPDLQIKVGDGRFRQDLWYRIAVFPIELPALRDRPQDLGALANHFAKRAAKRFGFRPLTVNSDELALLLAYSWPGNARELAAVMDRAVILGQGRCLDVAKALGMPLGPNDIRPASKRVDHSSNQDELPLGNNAANGTTDLNDVVRQHIENILTQTKGRIEGHGGAAELLGINPHTLRARMNKLRLDWKRFRDT